MTEISIDPAAEFRAAMLMPGWPHEAPERPFTINEAHAVMQAHIECQVSSCARKRAAWQILVDAGEIVPAAGRAQ